MTNTNNIPATLSFKLQSAYAAPASLTRQAAASKLVAGNVSGKVSFPSDTVEISSTRASTPAREVLPMYTNPAAKNSAATGIVLGRSLDTRG